MPSLPSTAEMYEAVVKRDTGFDGVFIVAVRTTGIFCRPGCGARTPNQENVEFFRTTTDALHAGYRPCQRCRPMDAAGTPPPWVRTLFEMAERSTDRVPTAAELRAIGIEPTAAARYFKSHYGMTFTSYCRARRMSSAMRTLRAGITTTDTAARTGFQSTSGLRDAFAGFFGVTPSRATDTEPIFATWIESPLGPLLAMAGAEGVCLLEFTDRRALLTQIKTIRTRFGSAIIPEPNAHLLALQRQLSTYFQGDSLSFDLPLIDPGTDFQRRVWSALRAIPPGETRSYAQIAKAIGNAAAVRAVARANGDNRLAILIPCHRVIGSDGSLTGYGGGMWRKQWLLDHERRLTPTNAHREKLLF